MFLTVGPPGVSEFNVMGLIGQAIVFATDVWTTFIESTGLWGHYFGAILGLLLLRFILVPIFGHQVSLGGSSDLASRHVTKQLRAAQKEENHE